MVKPANIAFPFLFCKKLNHAQMIIRIRETEFPLCFHATRKAKVSKYQQTHQFYFIRWLSNVDLHKTSR